MAISGEDWLTGMAIYMNEMGWASCFYYLIIVLMGQFFILNFVLGVLLESVGQHEDAESEAYKVHER